MLPGLYLLTPRLQFAETLLEHGAPSSGDHFFWLLQMPSAQ